MKLYKTVDVPATKKNVLVKRKCDLCGAESKSSDWAAGVYDTGETEIRVTVKCKEGALYPEGGSGTEIEIDLCPECFRRKLIPQLKQWGAKVEERRWES